MGKLKMIRHGDILLKQPEGFSIPASVALEHVALLHKGDNHAHTIVSGDAQKKETYFRALTDVTVDHAEHGKGIIPKGDYLFEIKSEYDHFAEESRQVLD